MRNNSIDTLKFICAILVISIHTPKPDNIWPVIDPILRCAVPIFLMLSGYFIYREDGINEKLQQRIVPMLKILCWGALFHIGILIILEDFSIFNKVSLTSIKNLIFYNNFIFSRHLWYIHAYLYVLVIILIANRFNFYKALIYATPVLLAGGVILGKYHEPIFGENIDTYFSRNFLFTGLPFFIIGMVIREKRLAQHINLKLATIGCLIFYITGIIEAKNFKICYNSGDLYITTAFMAFFILMLSLNIEQRKENILSRMGREDSLYIYIFHLIFADTMRNVARRFEFTTYYEYIGVPIVLAITIILIQILRKTKIIGRFI